MTAKIPACHVFGLCFMNCIVSNNQLHLAMISLSFALCSKLQQLFTRQAEPDMCLLLLLPVGNHFTLAKCGSLINDFCIL